MTSPTPIPTPVSKKSKKTKPTGPTVALPKKRFDTVTDTTSTLDEETRKRQEETVKKPVDEEVRFLTAFIKPPSDSQQPLLHYNVHSFLFLSLGRERNTGRKFKA